jgi:hypothetical protein
MSALGNFTLSASHEPRRFALAAIGSAGTDPDDGPHRRPRDLDNRMVRKTVDLRVLFEHGVEFEPSEAHAGLQLVDTVAYVVRQRVLHRDNETIMWAYRTLRPLLNTHEGKPMYLVRLAPGGDDADDRFSHL